MGLSDHADAERVYDERHGEGDRAGSGRPGARPRAVSAVGAQLILAPGDAQPQLRAGSRRQSRRRAGSGESSFRRRSGSAAAAAERRTPRSRTPPARAGRSPRWRPAPSRPGPGARTSAPGCEVNWSKRASPQISPGKEADRRRKAHTHRGVAVVAARSGPGRRRCRRRRSSAPRTSRAEALIRPPPASQDRRKPGRSPRRPRRGRRPERRGAGEDHHPVLLGKRHPQPVPPRLDLARPRRQAIPDAGDRHLVLEGDRRGECPGDDLIAADDLDLRTVRVEADEERDLDRRPCSSNSLGKFVTSSARSGVRAR